MPTLPPNDVLSLGKRIDFLFAAIEIAERNHWISGLPLPERYQDMKAELAELEQRRTNLTAE